MYNIMKWTPIYIGLAILMIAFAFHVPRLDFMGIDDARETATWIFQIAISAIGLGFGWAGIYDLFDVGDNNFA